ncbi:RING-H2 finger protein ATL11-like [Cynara cardunculus var. scolymus]|uniref:Zinc finger, RING/FYVE/PHD-type n=1 Tax=Cynara cardunculus var. scolymus TaxID=59895 RepID=A0A103XV81_CYNCS|nr:RING-H2 finger protein ATL11-like [Cynara cardunculus var. scolymus]KVH97513.1 Zinc finger, RING/FYVE/PHD-type [Cynara cardunculus var. scolymus]
MFCISTISSFIASLTAYLIWAWDILIHLCFFNHHNLQQLHHLPQKSQLGLPQLQWSSKEPVECAVCLSDIEEDEEIRVLRCDHLFHKRCLDRCIEYRHTTCPLCRDILAGPRMVCELGRELLFFSFCSTNSSSHDDDFDRWWIR